MNPRVIAWMAETGEKAVDGNGYKYIIWNSQRWAEWNKLQGRPPNSPPLERDHEAFDAWLDERARKNPKEG